MSDYHPDPTATLPLFYQRPPSTRGSATSAQAADSLSPSRLNVMHHRILEYVRSHDEGVTDEQIATALAMNPSTERPRRIELARAGLIVEACVRRTASGRRAVAWRVAG